MLNLNEVDPTDICEQQPYPPASALPLFNIGTRLRFLDTYFYPAGTTGQIVEIIKSGAFNGKHLYKVLLSTNEMVEFSQDNIVENNFGIAVEGLPVNESEVSLSWLNSF